MSQQGPIIVVSSGQPSPVTAALADTRIFPVIETCWSEATLALEELQPAAVLTSGGGDAQFAAFAARVAAVEPYVPLLVISPKILLPPNALPFALNERGFTGLEARLRAALRVRSLHAAVLLRLGDDHSRRIKLTDPDPLHDATVLLIGRGAAYPALSVALGERMGVV